jgi:foldase protein PrsA
MAFCAAIATAVVLGACGSGIPGNAVATVGSAPITKAALNHWIVVANDSSQGSSGTVAPPLPVPPNYTACMAAEKKVAANIADTPAQLKALCAQAYKSLVNEVMGYLINALWIEGEAADRGVKVTSAQVEKSFVSQRKASKPSLATTAALNSFLAKSGQTIADLKWRTYLNLLYNGLLLQVQKQAEKVTPAQISAYYHSHLSSLTTPETRNVHLIETQTAATAAKVKSLLAGGTSYATLAPKYSIDPTSKGTGGSLLGVRTGELNAQITAAIFAAKVNVLTGPLKTAFGYYVFTVNAITPAVTPTLSKATTEIKSAITSARETAAQTALTTAFTKTWPSRTTCATGYITASVCGNAPKTSSTSSTGATTGATSASTGATSTSG